MDPTAHVANTSSLEDLRAALITFRDRARDVLSSVALNLRKQGTWLEEQLEFWKQTVRRSEDAVFQARQDLKRRQIIKFLDRSPDTTEQEKALRLAQARLEFAQEKLAATKHWLRDWPEALLAYEGPARNLQNLLEADVPRALVFLLEKIMAVEAYQEM